MCFVNAAAALYSEDIFSLTTSGAALCSPEHKRTNTLEGSRINSYVSSATDNLQWIEELFEEDDFFQVPQEYQISHWLSQESGDWDGPIKEPNRIRLRFSAFCFHFFPIEMGELIRKSDSVATQQNFCWERKRDFWCRGEQKQCSAVTHCFGRGYIGVLKWRNASKSRVKKETAAASSTQSLC